MKKIILKTGVLDKIFYRSLTAKNNRIGFLDSVIFLRYSILMGILSKCYTTHCKARIYFSQSSILL